MYKIRIGEISNLLRIETAKNASLERKNLKEVESQKYESNKKKTSKLQEDLRMSILDHAITGKMKEPLKISRIKVTNFERELL